MKSNLWLVAAIVLGLISCNDQAKKTDLKAYQITGDSIAQQTQKVLLQNLTQAISEKGIAAAFSYCNLHADSLLTTALDKNKIASIQRLTDKNRNPNNQLTTAADIAMFEKFKQQAKDTVLQTTESITYYKPIKIAMPTCLKCHGGAQDIDKETAMALSKLYPNDLAKNYKEGDLRGMWKIQFKK